MLHVNKSVSFLFHFLLKKLSSHLLGIWFQNRRRIAVQSHRSSSRRNNPSPLDHNHLIQLELEEILNDLDLHKNAPQRMPIGQSTSSRRARPVKK